MEGAQVSVTEALLASFPNAVKEKDINGHMPLHWAVMQDTRPMMLAGALGPDGPPPTTPVVATVLRAYPEAAACFDVEGNLPLHCAAADNAPLDVLKILIEANPAAGALGGAPTPPTAPLTLDHTCSRLTGRTSPKRTSPSCHAARNTDVNCLRRPPWL